MESRNWVNDYAPLHPQIVADLKKLPVDRCVLDGELTFFERGTDRDVFVAALASPETRKRLDVEVKAELFDVLWVEDDSLEHLPFKDRAEIDEILCTLVSSGLEHVARATENGQTLGLPRRRDSVPSNKRVLQVRRRGIHHH